MSGTPPTIVIDHSRAKLNFVYGNCYESTHRVIAQVQPDGSVVFDWCALGAAIDDFPALVNKLGTPNLAVLLWAAYQAGLRDA